MPLQINSARRTAALVLALGLGLSACGGDDGGTDAASGSTTSSAAETSATESSAPAAPAPSSATEAAAEAVTVNAVDFDFELSEDSYSAGTYTFEVTNTGNMPHDFIVERDGAEVAGTEVLQPGSSATLEVTLEEGDYFFYCSVGAHRANGMEVPVTVSA
ncbi:cupredoxin domain-containing protein [Geodermatophilus sp. CPCC 206100]|uniref:cupredoxin domain-containing protein n=1 Tax=Geodermatophilus sp. CPCC 206100 TaxID=3020054 RepID=UPI003B003BC0